MVGQQYYSIRPGSQRCDGQSDSETKNWGATRCKVTFGGLLDVFGLDAFQAYQWAQLKAVRPMFVGLDLYVLGSRETM